MFGSFFMQTQICVFLVISKIFMLYGFKFVKSISSIHMHIKIISEKRVLYDICGLFYIEPFWCSIKLYFGPKCSICVYNLINQ